MGHLGSGLHRRGDCGRLEHLEEFCLNGVVDPEAAERDAARLAAVEPTAPAAVARDIVRGPGVAERQLASATAAAQQPGEQGIAVLGGAVVPADRDVVAHHAADRLRSFPVNVALVRAGPQRQPLVAWLAAYARAGPRAIIAHRHPSPAI